MVLPTTILRLSKVSGLSICHHSLTLRRVASEVRSLITWAFLKEILRRRVRDFGGMVIPTSSSIFQLIWNIQGKATNYQWRGQHLQHMKNINVLGAAPQETRNSYQNIPKLVSTLVYIWRFPGIGVPPDHPLVDRIFHWKPIIFGIPPPMTMETPIFLCCKTQSAYSAYSHTIARVRHSVWRRKKCTSQINDQGFRRKTVSQSSKSKKSPLSQCNRMFNYMSIATSLIVYHILYIKNYILYIIYHILYIIYYILYIIYIYLWNVSAVHSQHFSGAGRKLPIPIPSPWLWAVLRRLRPPELLRRSARFGSQEWP